MPAITATIAVARETCRHPATVNLPKHPKASIVAKFIVPAQFSKSARCEACQPADRKAAAIRG
jgi:hypothetical protein